MKRPAFQFYPADWSKDLGLRSCSLAARGLWMEMLCMAHESARYGCLELNGAPLSDPQIVNGISGATLKMLRELETAGVFSRDDRGTIFSRRMVRDERLREVRAVCGKLGGNPKLVGKEDKQNASKTASEVPPKDKSSPTPSSSSSSKFKSDVGVTPTISREAQADVTGNGAVEKTENSTTKVNGAGQNWQSASYVTATALTVGVTRRQGEDDTDFRDRVYAAIQQRLSEAKRIAAGGSP